MNFDRYIDHWARNRGDALYLACEDQSLTWGELDQAAGALAGCLAELGVEAGDRVGCSLPNCLEWCVMFAAAIRLGAIMVPLNVMFGSLELTQIAGDAGCAAVLATPETVARLGVADAETPERVKLYDLRGARPPRAYDQIVGGGGPIAPRNRRPDTDVLAICYTSGTTGVPKGVTLTHAAVERMNQRVAMGYGWRAGEERFLILAPLAFTGGIISNLTAQLLIGASGWLEKSADPERALKRLVDHKITFLGGVPALWERVAAAPGFEEADLSELRSGGTGGAPVPRPLLNRFLAKGVVIRQQYGVSENCGTVSFPDTQTAMLRPETCGPAVPGVEARICDDDGAEVAQGTVGEIRIRSDQLMLGYWNKPEETANAFDGDWYKTGDLGFFDEYGSIVVVDRKKNMLISGGVNIYPAEVERAMARIPGIIEVVVLGASSAVWGQEVVAIVHAPGVDDSRAMMAQARELLGSMKAPKRIVLSPQPLPKTVSNKIARTGLEALFERLCGEQAAV